ncbi:MAG: TonB-dependent receptor [Chitinophagaceae bacterium]|jgi:TonB-linked SusC/RagA family outer membrane protein|nr:TonB-dependent receptor [Chitinophagaceae bacterium]
MSYKLFAVLKCTLVFIATFIFLNARAQRGITITGTVQNEKSEPVPNASITIKGSAKGTTSGKDGSFHIDVPSGNSVLVVSSIGYQEQEITVGLQTTLLIKLVSSSNQLEQIVVVGYGTQKRTSVTAAVSTISGNDIAAKPVADLSNSIGGRVAGIIFTQDAGEPGNDGANLLIRGISTTGNTQPLVIVDGIPRSFNQLDPHSVASITILKDAAAVAPYGMAGANGVILITTKRGKTGDPTLEYSGYVGWQNPTRLTKFVNAFQYASMRNVANENVGSPDVYTADELQKFKDGSEPDIYPNHNVLKELITPNALITGHNLAFSGGSEKLRYYGGFGYLNQQGMWGPSNYKRYNLISNIEAQATATTKVSLSLNGRVEDRNSPGVSAANIFYQAFRTPPTAPLLYTNGLPGPYIGRTAWGNIFSSGYTSSIGDVLLSQFSLEQKLPFIKGLSLKAVVSYDLNEPSSNSPAITLTKTWLTPIPYYLVDTSTTPYTYPLGGNDGPAKPSYSVSYAQNQAFTYQGYLNYANDFGKHSVTAMMVLERRISKFTTLGAARTNYNVNVPELNNGSFNATDISNSGFSGEAKQQSAIFRVTYAYNNKYLLEGSGRYDGHYAFAPGKRYGFFPAISAGWRLSEEPFMHQISWIDNLKLRASYGESGALPYINGTLAAFQYLSSYSLYGNSAVINGSGTQGLTETLQANPNITWEKARKTNIGAEFSMFKGLFTLEADYFYEKRNNMLVAPNAIVPAEYGIGLAQENAGIMDNRGFEFTAGSTYRASKDITIGLTANFTLAKNKVLQIFENSATYDNPNRRLTGRPLGTQFGYKALGYFQTSDDKNGDGVIQTSEYPVVQFGDLHPGDLKYQDVNGDNQITPDDIVPIGKPATPQIIYGFSPSIRYKSFDFSLLFQGAADRDFYIANEAAFPFVNSASAVISTLDYWTPQNPNAGSPRVTPQPTTNNSQTSSWWIQDGSYIRLKTGELGYTFPASMLRTIRIQSARIYLSGQNILTWSKIKNFDPEISATNGEYYPQQKVISIGINVTF